MDLVVTRVDVWWAQVPDRPEGLGDLLDSLHAAGARLHSIAIRPDKGARGTSLVYVTPLRGDAQIAAASLLGFNVAHDIHCVEVMGTNRAGVAAEMAQRIGAAGISLRTFSYAALGDRFIAHVCLDRDEDVTRIIHVMELYDASHA